MSLFDDSTSGKRPSTGIEDDLVPIPIAQKDNRSGKFLKQSMTISKAVVSLFLGPPTLSHPPARLFAPYENIKRSSFDLHSQPRFNQREVDPSNMDSFIESFSSLDPKVLSDTNGGIFIIYAEKVG
jgi:hypothetical protein